MIDLALIYEISSILTIGGTVPVDQLIEIEKTFYTELNSFWRQYNLFTLRWWFLVVLSIFPPIIWWLLVDKKRIIEITAFGLFFGVAAILLDSIGSNLLLWVYPIRLTPYLYPQLYPYDVAIIIIPFMLVYQKWGNSFKQFFVSAGLTSAFVAFIGETSMAWLNIYKQLTWKHYYSFPIYWLLALLCYGIIRYLKKAEQKS